MPREAAEFSAGTRPEVATEPPRTCLQAIDCRAFHHEYMPSSFYPRAARPGHVALEHRFPEATQSALTRRGHRLRIGESWSEGRLSGCARETTPEGPILKAAANPRGMQGYAIGR